MIFLVASLFEKIMQDIARKHDVSSNTVWLCIECVVVGIGLVIVLNCLSVVEEFMAGKEVLLHNIIHSKNKSLPAPNMLVCDETLSSEPKRSLNCELYCICIAQHANCTLLKIHS